MRHFDLRHQTLRKKPFSQVQKLVSLYIENGQTIVTYEGTAGLPNGEIATIDEKVVLDFIVSDNLP